MANHINVTTGNMDHAENFIDLDDLDLAGIELTSWEVVAGGAFTEGCGLCSSYTTTSSNCGGGGGSNY